MLGHPGLTPAAEFQDRIIGEVFYALGASRTGILRRVAGPILAGPAGRLGRVAARADGAAAVSGISGAARHIMPDLSLRISVRGAATLPADGPLLIAANHPGGLDSVAILASLPRNDVNVVISDVPFSRTFRAAGRFFVFTPPGPAGRAAALRTAIERLRAGQALLVFPFGDVEPDPEVDPDRPDRLGLWSRSVEIMLRKAPATKLVAAIASGALSPRFARNPLVRLRRSAARRQKLAEALQFVCETARPGSAPVDIHISFAKPVPGADLVAKKTMPEVAAIARRLLADHLEALGSGRFGC